MAGPKTRTESLKVLSRRGLGLLEEQTGRKLLWLECYEKKEANVR